MPGVTILGKLEAMRTAALARYYGDQLQEAWAADHTPGCPGSRW